MSKHTTQTVKWHKQCSRDERTDRGYDRPQKNNHVVRLKAWQEKSQWQVFLSLCKDYGKDMTFISLVIKRESSGRM